MVQCAGGRGPSGSRAFHCRREHALAGRADGSPWWRILVLIFMLIHIPEDCSLKVVMRAHAHLALL